MLNCKVFENIKKSGKHILIVTKYWDEKKTKEILESCETDFPDEFLALGENRIESIKEKNLPREKVHFIGNIQSRKIPEITQYCSTIHSLTSLKHAEKIEAQGIPIQAFVQIKLDKNKSIGISEEELAVFLEACKKFQYLKIIGISGMGSGNFGDTEKSEEFQKLISLKQKYIPEGSVSAGTSRDYVIALKEGIDIVRVGSLITL